MYCGYAGGAGWDVGRRIAVDGSGNSYITGYTTSDEATFPVRVGPDLTHNGDYDAFVAKISSYSLLNAPVLTSPAAGAISQPLDAVLQWQDTNSIPQELTCKVRIKAAGGGYKYYTANQNTISYMAAKLLSNKTYYWNVQAAGDGIGIMSSEWANGGVDWSFTTSAPVTLNPPGLVAPADNAPDQPLNLNLQWTDTNSVFQEKGYQIRIKPAGGAYTNVTTAKNVVSYLKKALAKNKTYYWNVRALGNGTSTKNSLWANSEVDWKFSTIK